MQIIVNGDTHEVAEDFTAAQLVEKLGLGGRRVAMEVNLDIVTRSQYEQHTFKDGDNIELVHAIGGG